MAQVTSPIILDSTGQQIHSDLQQIKTVLTTPSAAEDITFDNTGTGMQADDVQDAITELKSNLTELEPLKEYIKSNDPVVIGTYGGKTLYRRYMQFSNVVGSSGQEVLVSQNILPNNVDYIAILDMSEVKIIGNVTFITQANSPYNWTYFIGRSLYYRQLVGAAVNHSELYLWVAYTLND